MATIKSFTDINQAKVLAKILPLESADIYWDLLSKDKYAKVNNIGNCLGRTCVYAWSLAALLDVLPEKYTELIKEGGMYRIIIKDSYMTCLFDNPVDACVNMIIKLHELKML